jgi:dTDP-glucose 4,6-dehydratase
VLRQGHDGEVYNIGGGHEVANIDLTRALLAALGHGDEMIRWVQDRAGHDRRYSIDCARVRALGWAPQVAFEDGLARTVAWYREHRAWWEKIKSGEWQRYYAKQYGALAADRPKDAATTD